MYQRLLMSMDRKLKTSINPSSLVIDGTVNIIRGGADSGITGRQFIYRCCRGCRLKSHCHHTSCLEKQHIPLLSPQILVGTLACSADPPHRPHTCTHDIYELTLYVSAVHGGLPSNMTSKSSVTSYSCCIWSGHLRGRCPLPLIFWLG